MNTEPRRHSKVHDFLKRHRMGILSTADAEGMPWGAAIYFVADDDFNFYFVTRSGTHKYHNIDRNPRAAITVADPASQTTVQASGTVSKVPVEDYMDVVFNKLSKIKPKDDVHWSPPINKLDEGNFMPLKLTPTKLHYADYKHLKRDIRADYIEKII